MNQKKYRIEELIGLSDDELLDILVELWGAEDKKFEAWGELEPLGDRAFGFLANVSLLKNDYKLYYPSEKAYICTASFFVPPRDATKVGSKEKAVWISCELELSSLEEREKHNNPLLMCVKEGSAKKLKELPENFGNKVITVKDLRGGDHQLIFSSIYDFYFEKAEKEISEALKEKKKKFDARLVEQEQVSTERLSTLREETELEEKKKAICYTGWKSTTYKTCRA